MNKKALIISGAIAGGLLLLATAGEQAVKVVLSIEHEAFLRELHQAVAPRFRAFIDQVQKKTGYNVIITSGYRTYAHQARLHREDSRNAKPGFSHHNFGMALDINLQKGTEFLRKASPKEAWLRTGVVAIGKQLGFRWGGEFGSYYDPVHFDTGKEYSTTRLHALAEKQFGTNPEKVQGNKVKLT